MLSKSSVSGVSTVSDIGTSCSSSVRFCAVTVIAGMVAVAAPGAGTCAAAGLAENSALMQVDSKVVRASFIRFPSTWFELGPTVILRTRDDFRIARLPTQINRYLSGQCNCRVMHSILIRV